MSNYPFLRFFAFAPNVRQFIIYFGFFYIKNNFINCIHILVSKSIHYFLRTVFD